MSSSRKLGTTKSNASSRRSSFGAASTTSTLNGARKVSNALEYSSRTGKVSTTTPARPTITAPSTPSVSGPSSSSAAALKRNKHASQRTTTIQTQSSPPDSKPHTASLQWSSTKPVDHLGLDGWQVVGGDAAAASDNERAKVHLAISDILNALSRDCEIFSF